MIEDVTRRVYEQREEHIEAALRDRFDGWIEFSKPQIGTDSDGDLCVVHASLRHASRPETVPPGAVLVRLGPWGRA